MRRIRLDWELTGPVRAPAVVLLHSLGHDRSMWDPQVDDLAGRYRLLRPDMRGHGASPSPDGPYSIEELAGDVLGILDDAGIDGFHLVGMSIGGQIAMRVAVDHAHRVASLVLCNTAPRIGSEEGWRERIAAIETGGMESIREGVIDRWFAAGFETRQPDRFAAANASFSRVSRAGYIGCCRALAASDLTGDVSSIRAPTLVIGGELDVSTPPRTVEDLQARIPGSRLQIIAGAGHLSNLDRAEEFTGHLEAFVAGGGD